MRSHYLSARGCLLQLITLPSDPPFLRPTLQRFSTYTRFLTATYATGLFFAGVLFFSLPSQQAAAQDQKAEEEAIKAAVWAETYAYFNRNAEAWQAAWIQDARASRTTVESGRYEALVGWENFGPQMIQWMKANPSPAEDRVEKENYSILIREGVAWVEYDQQKHYIEARQNKVWHTRQQRMLLKEDGQWKIASMTVIHASSIGDSPEVIAYNLNLNGRLLLQANRLKEAIEVFKLTIALFPEAWQSYQNLAEAYARSGQKKQAIKQYEKALALNPNDKKAMAALEELQGTVQATIRN
jgi:tetratricopeptide (TPR) repeat protein